MTVELVQMAQEEVRNPKEGRDPMEESVASELWAPLVLWVQLEMWAPMVPLGWWEQTVL